MTALGRPVRVAAVNDYEIIVNGVAAVLSAQPGLQVCDRIVMGDPIEGGPIDVALYDTYGRVGVATPALEYLSNHSDIAAVAMFSIDLSPAMIADGRAAGAKGFISKKLSGPEIAGAIIELATEGHEVMALDTAPDAVQADLDWPGKGDGLSERESQVLVLLAEGLTNAEIGEALYLGSETVKTYVRQAFQKLGVRNRVQATRFVIESGAFARYQPAEPLLE